jgi:phosphoserine aminotransferase
VRDLGEVLNDKFFCCASGEYNRGNGDGVGRAFSCCSHRIRRYDNKIEVAIKNVNSTMAINSNFDSLVLRGDQRVSWRSSFIQGGFKVGFP